MCFITAISLVFYRETPARTWQFRIRAKKARGSRQVMVFDMILTMEIKYPSVAACISMGLLVLSCRADDLGARNRFLKLIDRPRVALAPEVSEAETNQGIERYHFSYMTERGVRVPGILVKPAGSKAKLPVIIALHGTGGNKESQRPFIEQMASMGFIGIAIDGRYHGERTSKGSGSAAYREAILRAYRTREEHPFLYDTVWDILRLIDYIGTRQDADPARIGMIGFSKGGMETYLAAAVDPRIRVAVPCIGVESFRWALEHDAWQSRVSTFQTAVDGAAKDNHGGNVDAALVRAFYDRVAPGIYSDFDGPAMVPLIAPRALLIINGDSDARTPRPGLMECIRATKAAYEKARAEDRFQFILEENTGHRVTPQAMQQAVEWLKRWLL
jgi:dienelactone hydrolase